FLGMYEDWLRKHTLAHSRDHFRRWLELDYIPGGYQAVLELLDLPKYLPCGKPVALRVRAHNTGTTTWRFQPESNAREQLHYVLTERQGGIVDKSRAGLFEASVAPGESIDLTIALSPLPGPGPYRLFVDLMDEQHLCFFQGGSEPWEGEFEARDEVAAAGS